MDRDALSSWLIRTIAEAKKHQENFHESLTKLTARFFKPKVKSITVNTEATLKVVDKMSLEVWPVNIWRATR
jgi:hypothetical protein